MILPIVFHSFWTHKNEPKNEEKKKTKRKEQKVSYTLVCWNLLFFRFRFIIAAVVVVAIKLNDRKRNFQEWIKTKTNMKTWPFIIKWAATTKKLNFQKTIKNMKQLNSMDISMNTWIHRHANQILFLVHRNRNEYLHYIF